MRLKITKPLIVTTLLLAATASSCKKSEMPKAPPEPVAPPRAVPKPAKTTPTPAPQEPESTADPDNVPSMPKHWKVINNVVVPAAKVTAISTNLGGRIETLRNTIYNVGGKRVQLNIIDAADVASADRIMARLKRMKSEKALLQHSLRIFEFVGKNDALAEIIKARDKLAADLQQ